MPRLGTRGNVLADSKLTRRFHYIIEQAYVSSVLIILQHAHYSQPTISSFLQHEYQIRIGSMSLVWTHRLTLAVASQGDKYSGIFGSVSIDTRRKCHIISGQHKKYKNL